jgi:hypothetical protein
MERGETQQYCSEVGSKFEANHGWSCPETQQSTAEAIVREGERIRFVGRQIREEEQATISQREVEGFANLFVFLVFF